MAARGKPTVVFFAGAFADPSCFDRISSLFRKAGYPTSYAYVPSLRSSDPASASCGEDIEATRNRTLIPLIEKEHKDVVLFVHSYGGLVGGAAAAGLSKSARTGRGEEGGVIGLVYCVGNVVQEGQTLMEAMGGAGYPPFIKKGTPGPGLAIIEPAMQILYNDVQDSALRPELEAGMYPTALRAFETPASAPAWKEEAYDGRRAYIRTLDDNCNPIQLQDKWLETSGVRWDTVELKSSHCPFVSFPEVVVDTTLGFIEKWA